MMGEECTPRGMTQAGRSQSSVDLFITKLGHRLLEIRERAADSLLSAVSLGLLPSQQLAERLRSQLLLPGWEGRQQALRLLDQIATKGPVDGERLSPERQHSPVRRVGGERSPLRRVGGEHSPGSAGRQPSPVRDGPWRTASPGGDQPEQIGDGPDQKYGGDFIPVLFTPDDNDTAGMEDRMSAASSESDQEDQEQDQEPPDEGDIIHSLPWKSLIASDLHVLTSTAGSLTSGDGRAVRQALHFLHDVTLRDFPAEVFLQRPVLLQAVFHVLVSTDESETDVLLSCLECLTVLTETLLHRCDVIAAPETRQTATLTAGPTAEEAAGALSLPTFCGQLLSQALSCLYVRHWAVLVAAARLGAAVCRLGRRAVPARLWTAPQGEAEQRAQQALMKALKVFDEVLRWHHKCYRSGESVHLHRAGWLLAAALLADAWASLRPPPGLWARRHRLLAAPLHVLLDELLFAQQPALHARLLRLVTDSGCARLWRRLERLRSAMEAARRLVDGGGRADALAAAAAIELHGGRELVEKAVAAVCETPAAEGTPAGRQKETEDGKEEAEGDESAGGRLLLRLLSSPVPVVRSAAYRGAAAAARAALRDAGRRTVPALIQPAVLELALTDGLSDRQIESDATDLVLYAVTSEAWVPRLRPVLVTALPLFLCHVTRPQLTRPLNHVIGLCRAEHLRSDLILTTHRSRAVREDAWSRIVSRLSAQNATVELLPDLSQLGALDLAELTLVAEPPPVASRRGEVNDVLTLTALLPLAWCGTAALDVRRATLSQVAVLLQDPDLHRAFLDHDGLARLLSSMTRAVLREPDLAHDISLLPDCVSALRHLALFSAGCRHHLGDDPQLLLLLVRVLLMFRLDERVRAAAAQLLLAASLDSALVCRRRPGQHIWEVLVPPPMDSALRLPFAVTARPRRPLGRAPGELPPSALTEPVTVCGERLSVTGLLRTAWSLAWHGELRAAPAAAEYSQQLQLPEWQLAAAEAGQLQRVAADTLRHLEGVCSHTAARVLLSQLGCYVTLHRQTGDTDSDGIFSASAADRWLSVLRRHLLTPPTSEPDRRVLTAALQLLLLLPAHSRLPDRAVTLLSEHSQVFTDSLVRAADHPQQGQRQTALRALQLLAELCCRSVPGAADLLDSLTSQAVSAAAGAGSEHFYSLVSVQRCAALLQTALLSPHPLPETLHPSVRLLRDLCAAFLPASGPADSCMGAGVLAAAALCLPAVTDRLCEWGDACAAAWSADVPDGGRLLWLSALWHHQDTQVRWGGLAVALGLTRWPEGAALLTHQTRHLPGGCWGASLGLLLDEGEAAAVREQAALLLASLTAHLDTNTDTETDTADQLCGPEVTNAAAEVCLTGPGALVTLLENADWAGQLSRLVTQLQTGTAADSEQTVTPGLAAAALRLSHNAAVLCPVDLVGPLTDTVHTLLRFSDALGVGGGWRGWPPAEVAPFWTEALRLCSALVMLEQPGRPGAAHLLLCDRRALDAAAGTAVTTGDTELCEGLFSLLLSLLSSDREEGFSASAELLLSWPELWPALAAAPALLEPLLATEAARLLRLSSGAPLLAGLESAGEPLCAALLAGGAASRRPLAALLLVSAAAKRAALQAQLHRRLTGQLRENIAALVTGSLSVRAARSKVKERSLLSDLVSDLDLLRNLMSGSAEVKQALASDGLPNLLHKLWPWCVTSRQLTVTVLCTLNTLAAGCTEGARGLAYTSAALHQAPSGSPSGASLVHVVLDDCQRHLERRSADSGAVQRLAVSFSLLAAAALVQEGRAIICRSSFLSGFRFWRGGSSSAPASEQKRRLAVTRLWMLLIKNVTFFDEGQKVVARIPEVTGSLVALMSQEDTSLRSSAVLVLRNLSYITAMQTALINTDGFVEGVAAALGSGQPAASCAAAALCLQLLTSSRKARAVLTSTAHLEKLKSAADSLDVAADEMSSEVFSRVRDMLRQEGPGLAGQAGVTAV
ncbi:rotatin-like [Amphibalanus amphitrite]|uniref:rotatin-like n=1 Tax=Amphibalanus amphitrite TaxID=1232801 RepID=UPI001C922623|nr:rotatin-like [Amphibalanus amphitrite]